LKLRTLFDRPATWWTLAVVAAIVLSAAALSETVYEATSPSWLDYYVELRKFYSIVAFGLVGYLVARARRAAGQAATPLVIGAIIAFYSAFIEALQSTLSSPPEGLVWSAFDIACGLVGGVLGALAAKPRRSN
jgi:hypothetical protein